MIGFTLKFGIFFAASFKIRFLGGCCHYIVKVDHKKIYALPDEEIEMFVKIFEHVSCKLDWQSILTRMLKLGLKLYLAAQKDAIPKWTHTMTDWKVMRKISERNYKRNGIHKHTCGRIIESYIQLDTLIFYYTKHLAMKICTTIR